jgi:hypothetical protein
MKRIVMPIALVVGLLVATATAFAGTHNTSVTSCCPLCDAEHCPFMQ